MSNYDGKIELPQTYYNQVEEQYLSSDKSDSYLWLAEENTKQAKQIARLQEQLKEANDVIKEYADSSNWTREYNEYSCTIKEDCVFYDSEGWKEAKDYLEKWGVK